MTTVLTFDGLCALEPALRQLFDEAAAERRRRRGPHYCANAKWYTDLKPKLLELVGWLRRGGHPVLCSAEAYDVAYEAIYQQLPDCGDCLCASPEDFR